ncbi:MAG: HAMP domain-containing histidine kinase [Methylotenera sp.]|nr:HAMP domain-containing histidine kinase [Oligoflexia bacterium]
MWRSFRLKSSRLSLQAKISLVLLSVLVPTFLVVTVAENKLMQPLLADQVKQIGITTGQTLATEIVTQKLLSRNDDYTALESRVREFLYLQPSIRRMDVYLPTPSRRFMHNIASSVEEEPEEVHSASILLTEEITADYRRNELDENDWEITVPIVKMPKNPKNPKKILGVVHVNVSMKLVNQIIGILLWATAAAATFSTVFLFLGLSYFLRKTVYNDRKLREAENQNLQLISKLHETERLLMNTEKLAVMGQLTASFAHEIGTPLNAIGGHLQLLKEEMDPASGERMNIIEGQLGKIEQIVKGFLQSTAKPTSQKQLVDLPGVIDQTLRIVRPRSESMSIEIRRDYDRLMGPIRIVPLDLEQILLNLVNNSLDSLRFKIETKEHFKRVLAVSSHLQQEDGNDWAVISIYDTGEGIKKQDISQVLKPFFTTKRPGEGTGLGLTICQELAHKYGGHLEVESKESAWTRVTVKLPYRSETAT